MITALVLWYLIRTIPGYIERGEQGPFLSLEACETELATYANSQGLFCRAVTT